MTKLQLKDAWIRSQPTLVDNSVKIGDTIPGVTIIEWEDAGDFYKFYAYVHKSVASPLTESALPAVPYVSQLEGDASYGNDCGPACVSMLLAFKNGKVASPNQICRAYFANQQWFEFDGIWRIGRYTTFNQAKQYLASNGVQSYKTYPKLSDISAPCMILVNYSKFPERMVYDWKFYQSDNAFHFIVLVGKDTDGYYYVHDPLQRGEKGVLVKISESELSRTYTGSALVLS